ncbi:hypothetical protein FXW78_22220 [Rhodococcus opacus]|nr:hypothetical protein [Rhodococcus opacus]
MLRGTNILRIVWVPGTDRLRGVCHCGAAQEAEDPTALWEWLLAHPVGHTSPPIPEPHAPHPRSTPEDCVDTAPQPAHT